MSIPHLPAVAEALDDITEAIEKASARLPAHLKQQQWISTKTAPCSWEALHFRYLAHKTHTPEEEAHNDAIADLLSDLTELAICREKLAGILARRNAQARPVDLSLPRVRRTHNE